MTTRKQMNKDATDEVPPRNQQSKGGAQEEEGGGGGDSGDDQEELSSLAPSKPSPPPPPPSSKGKRRRERETKSAPEEMTEEEMMALALRLSQQEANIAALEWEQEEEAVMKAIEESEEPVSDAESQREAEEEVAEAGQEMVGQTQPLSSSPSQSLVIDGSSSLASRRKLLYPNRKWASAGDQGTSGGSCTWDADLSQGLKGTGDENNNQKKKCKRRDGSPLLEMPDLSQTQKRHSLFSSGSSLQDSDSSDTDHSELHKSPVFCSSRPLACKSEVHIPKLSQELLATCKTSGFVLCSQDSLTSSQKPLPSQPKSPTFPKSPARSKNLSLPKATTFLKSPAISQTDRGVDGETECSKSPVFGRTGQNRKSLLACKPEVPVCKLSQEVLLTCETSGFVLCSEESLTSSENALCGEPKSPVFPRSPDLSKTLAPSKSPPFPKSPAFSETDQGEDRETGQNHNYSTSPVFGRTSPVFGRTSRHQPVGLGSQNTAGSSAAEDRESSSEGRSGSCCGSTGSHQDSRNPPRCLREGNGIDHDEEDKFGKITIPSQSDDEEEPEGFPKAWDSARTNVTSDMTLRWSDEDDVVTQLVDSPSPVFPEERPLHQPDNQPASQNHVAAASPGTPSGSPTLQRRGLAVGAKEARRLDPFTRERDVSSKHHPHGPSSSSQPTGQQQLPENSDCRSRPEGPGGATVHYYWGVPFCPRGLDPDAYTKVILAQMEVYEKSLKQAQRGLLRKAEWGEAILPQPEKSSSPASPAELSPLRIPRRRRLRLRGKRSGEEPTVPPPDEEDKDESEEYKEREKRNKEEEEGEVDIDTCEVCPETQLGEDDDSTQELIMTPDAGAESQPKSLMLPEIQTLLQDPPADQEQMEVEVDAPVDGEMEMNVLVSANGGQDVHMDEMSRDPHVEGMRRDPHVEERKDVARRTSPEAEAAAASQSPVLNVDCPICQGFFPVSQIEMHAAYCDGEVDVVEVRPETDSFRVSLTPRKKRTRRGEATGEDATDPPSLGEAVQRREKCYICQKAIPLRDYDRHTEDCIQRRASTTELKGKLLSALEQTDGRDSEAGPSGSNLSSRPGDATNLQYRDESEPGQAFRISSSPIRSFTPISEATDCLVDFKNQHATRKPGRRRRR